MMMGLKSCDGITFASSARGWRYDRMKQHAGFIASTGCVFFVDYFQRGELDWDGPVIWLLVWAVMSRLMRGSDKRRVFGSQVRIREDHLDVVDADVSACIP